MHFDWEPAAGGLLDFGIFEAEEARDGGAGEVDVEDADGLAGEGEGEGELCCYGGFADAAFAREDLEWGLATCLTVVSTGRRDQSGEFW